MLKHTSALLAVTAVALAGCGGAATNSAAPANAASVNNSASAAPAAPAPSAAGAVDQAFLVGHWGVAGDCSRTLSFNADGSAAATGDDDAVRWSLEGNTIVTTEGNDAPERATVARNGDALSVTPQSGRAIQLTRCPSAAAEAPAGAAPGGEAPKQ